MSDQDLTTELNDAIADLEDALQRAAGATARIKTTVPHLTRISSMFGELESIIDAGRRSGEWSPGAPVTEPPARTRPTLVVPSTPARTGKRPADTDTPRAAAIDVQIESLEAAKPAESIVATPEPESDAPDEWQATAPQAPAGDDTLPDLGQRTAPLPQASNEPTTTFRLEFESTPGPLDLRAVDDAVSQHPSVRDVALLDYDGRRATLKVWIVATTSPAEVQQTLAARAAQITSNGSEISIVALEDVA